MCCLLLRHRHNNDKSTSQHQNTTTASYVHQRLSFAATTGTFDCIYSQTPARYNSHHHTASLMATNTPQGNYQELARLQNVQEAKGPSLGGFLVQCEANEVVAANPYRDQRLKASAADLNASFAVMVTEMQAAMAENEKELTDKCEALSKELEGANAILGSSVEACLAPISSRPEHLPRQIESLPQHIETLRKRNASLNTRCKEGTAHVKNLEDRLKQANEKYDTAVLAATQTRASVNNHWIRLQFQSDSVKSTRLVYLHPWDTFATAVSELYGKIPEGGYRKNFMLHGRCMYDHTQTLDKVCAFDVVLSNIISSVLTSGWTAQYRRG
jgi:hypothetical protein